MCGIIAIYSQNNSAQKLYQGMLQLQHRGQDAAGIATLNEGLFVKRGLGRVNDVFTQHSLSRLPGTLGIGHTRYATSGGTAAHDVQPFCSDTHYGIALAHSGHLHPAPWMAPFKENKTQSLVDSNLLVQFLGTLLEESHTISNDASFFSFLCQALTALFQQVKGSYSLVSLITGKGLLIIRDPQGIRPLVMGERINSLGNKEYLFASESHFFNELEFTQIEDIQPGEVLYVTPKGQLYRQILVKNFKTPCSFEYVYFAQPKSIINGVLVEDTRQKIGRLLALRWQQLYPQLTPDFVLPIPNTANTAAFAFAHCLGFAYQEYLHANKQIGRTFIQNNFSQRHQAMNNKLAIDPEKIKNKVILLFDDSMVRGTTAIHLIKNLRSLGAKTVYLVLACPPIINVCAYGINIPTKHELIASGRSIEEIKTLLDVDELLYATTEELLDSIYPKAINQSMLCMRCMHKTM